MTDLEMFRKTILDWANANLNSMINTFWQVYWANQNAPSPAPNFISMLITSMENVGLPFYTEPDDEGNRLILFDRNVNLNINLYGDGAIQCADDLLNSLYKQESIEAMNGNGVSFIVMNNFTDTTRLLEKTYQESASLDLLFSFRPSLSENIGFIKSVEAQGIYQQDNEVLYTDNIIVERGD